VLEVLRMIQPKKLFIAADGPRSDVLDDKNKCELTRSIVDEMVDWKCQLHKNYAEENMGCGLRPSTAISWFFENVESGIILEDDCVPHLSFFRYCEELLEYYKDNEMVMHISGNNFQFGHKRGKASYYFSTLPHVWGWATWRRAWKHFDFFLAPVEEQRHIWDRQWLKSVRRSGGVAILPNVNLVSNIGFETDATHTKSATKQANVPFTEMVFPLHHPKCLRVDYGADWYYRILTYTTTLYSRFNLVIFRFLWKF
jgi:hypothetical protein